MKKNKIAWLLSAAMIMTTAAPVESAYAAEEFQAEEMKVAAFEDAESREETGTDTYGAEETSETDGEDTVAEPDSDSANAVGVDGQTDAGAFDDSAEELIVDTDSASEQEEAVQTDDGFSDGEAEVAGVESVMGRGSCGDSATYTLYSDGRLVIEGSGEVEKDFYDNEKNIKSVEIGEGITSLKNYSQWSGVFQDCSNLVSVTLSESLINIGDYTFRNCGSLKEIVIPKGVTSIGEYAFDGCSSLSSIILSDKITSIGNYAFYNTGLKEISLPDTLTEIGSNVFSSCSDLRKVKLPSGIKKISAGMFDNCERLNSIELPSGVTEIGDSAFSGCSRLTSLDLPKGLTSIGNGAFSGSGIINFNLPDGLKTIGDSAFSSGEFSTIKIPDSVTAIGAGAFSRNDNLKSIEISDGVTEIKASTFLYDYYIVNIKLPKNLKTIGDNAFGSCRSLYSIEIPENVTDIGEYAFESCNMAEIQLPKSLTSLKYGTFMSCSNLTTIRIPKAVTSIDTDAFKGCQALRCIYVENSFAKIEKRAFGYKTDTDKNDNFVVIGQKNSTAEKYATENSFTFHNVTDPLKYCERVEATCVSDGNMEYWYCDKCGEKFSNAEGTEVPFYVEISKYGHNMEWISWESPSCITAGHESYYHCKTCGKNYSDYQGKTELTEKDIVIPAYGHNLEYNEAKEATCESEGNKEDYYCYNCDKYFLDKEGKQEAKKEDVIIPINELHAMEYHKASKETCLAVGNKEYYYCHNCGKCFLDKDGKQEANKESLIIPVNKNSHDLILNQGVAATCTNEGVQEYYVCSNCGRGFFDKDATKEIHDRSEIKIPATAHKWSSWKLVRTTSMGQTFQKGKSRPINILSDYMKMRTCANCGKQDWGQNLTYKLYINTDQVTLKYGQSTTAVRASGFTNGDYLKSVTAKNKNLVTVSSVNKNGTFKLTAKNKSGWTYITVKLNSGVNADVMIYIQKGKVSTSRITNLKSSVSVVRGSNVTLKPVLDPITSQDKITYSTSNKSIATVNSKGVVTGKKAGTAKITVKAGSKKAVVTVKVTPKVKTTKLSGVPKTKTVSRGKTFTIKATATPKNTEEKITYKSSNSKVATVSSKGVVKGIRKGTATITVQSGSKKLTCKVTVK